MAKSQNPYKKYIKAIINHHADYKLAIERKENDYYICDGISMLKVSVGLYEHFFMTSDEAFVQLADGEIITYPSGSFEGERSNGHSFSSLYANVLIKDYVQVTGAAIDDVSAFDHKVKRKIRVAVIGDLLAGFNDEYIVAAKEFAGVFLGTKSTAPIKWDNHVMGMLLMPIRADAFRQDIERIQKAKIEW